VISLVWRFLQTRNNLLPAFCFTASVLFGVIASSGLTLAILGLITGLFLTYIEVITQLSFRAPKQRKTLLDEDPWVMEKHDTKHSQVLSYTFAESKGAEPTLLLIHGWTSGASRMVGRAELFRKRGWNIIMIDLPNHGGSSSIHKWTAEYATTSVINVLNQLHKSNSELFENELYYYGHSMGGFIGLRLSKRRNELDWEANFGGWILESPMTGYSEIFDETSQILRIPKFLRPIVRWRMFSQFNALNENRPGLSSLAQTNIPIWGMTNEPTLLLQAHNDERLGDSHYLRMQKSYQVEGLENLLTSVVMEDLRHSGCAVHKGRDILVNAWLDGEPVVYSSSD